MRSDLGDAWGSRLEAALRTGALLARFHDAETGAHLAGVARCARILASTVAGCWGLGPDAVEAIGLFSVVHDIGKIAVPDKILRKHGPLGREETDLMQAHTASGGEFVNLLVARVGLEQHAHLPMLRRIVRSHHEHLDGSGYPDGLLDGQIPAEVRIVAVADVYHALRSERAYKGAWSREEVLKYLRGTRGKLFDEDCVDAALACAARLEEVVAAG